jgi:hypothetical protein
VLVYSSSADSSPEVIGLFIVAGWAFVGFVVSAFEKRLRSSPQVDQTMVTVLCVTGAVAGGFVGQITRLYVFGEPLGFAFSAAGAALLPWFYRARSAAPRLIAPVGDGAAPTATPPRRGSVFVEALGWGVLSGLGSGIGGMFGLLFASTLYPQRYSQFPPPLFFVPLGAITGFAAGVLGRLIRRHWSTGQMATLVVVLTIGYGAVMLNWGRNNAVPAKLTVVFEPNPATAIPCSSDCPAATPRLQWTVEGTVRVHDAAGLGGTIELFELSSHGPRYSRETVSGPNVGYTPRQLGKPARIRRDEPALYPFRYSYRTYNGLSGREISVTVQFTDSAGHHSTGVGSWSVQ